MTEHEFNTIFHQFRLQIFNYINKTVRNRHDAEEITSSVFVKLWTSQPILLTDEKTKAWLFISAKRRCLDHIKTYKYRMLRDKIWLAETPEWEELNTIELDVHSLVIEKIINILKEYTAQEKLVFTLHFVKGLKPGEIAKILKSKPQTVRNQLTSIRNKMKIKTGQ